MAKKKAENKEKNNNSEEAKKEDGGGLVFTRPRSQMWTAGGSVFWTAVIVFVVTAAVFGGGMYFFQDYFFAKKINTYKQQIENLSNDLAFVIEVGGFRSFEEVEEAMACPVLGINEEKSAVLARGEVLGFTRLSPEEGVNKEIVDFIIDDKCQRFAWSVMEQNSEESESRIYVSNFDGTSISIINLYNTDYRVYFDFFEDNYIVYNYRPGDYVAREWFVELAKPTARLNLRNEEVIEWGEAYNFSPTLTHVVIRRDGRDILIDAEDKNEVAVLSQDGTDEAIDYLFAPDGSEVAYLFFKERESEDFLRQYAEFCDETPESELRIWNLRTRKIRSVETGNLPGMRLVGWTEDNLVDYSYLKPQPAAGTIELP